MYSISLWNGGHIECHGFLYITLHIYALNKQEAPLSLKNCAIRKRHTAFSRTAQLLTVTVVMCQYCPKSYLYLPELQDVLTIKTLRIAEIWQ